MLLLVLSKPDISINLTLVLVLNNLYLIDIDILLLLLLDYYFIYIIPLSQLLIDNIKPTINIRVLLLPLSNI